MRERSDQSVFGTPAVSAVTLAWGTRSETWVIGPLQAIGKTVLMAAAARRYSLSVNVPNVSGCVFILTAAG